MSFLLADEIAIGSAVFSIIVLLLVVVVLVARSILAPSGTATVTVNDRTLTAALGRNLLGALRDSGIFLPSPCGARGMCGECRVTILGNVRKPLPAEQNHIDRAALRSGVRLACLSKVRGDVQLQIPQEYLSVRKRSCQVISTRNVSTFLREITVRLPPGDRLSFRAGQYVQVFAPPHHVRFKDFQIAPEYRKVWEHSGFLDLVSHPTESVIRAYSLANSPDQDQTAMLVVRIALPPPHSEPDTPPGHCSSYLFGLQPGDPVVLAGPYGDFQASDNDHEMVLIAGGAGIAPMRSIIFDQLEVRQTKRKISLWYGVRNATDLCYANEFSELAEKHPNFTWEAALSDASADEEWAGPTGFIHSVVRDQYLTHHPGA